MRWSDSSVRIGIAEYGFLFCNSVSCEKSEHVVQKAAACLYFAFTLAVKTKRKVYFRFCCFSFYLRLSHYYSPFRISVTHPMNFSICSLEPIVTRL